MKVCVIGAGVSGLTAIKCCLDENLVPVCYEKTGHIGGLWRYRDDHPKDVGSVARTTVLNTSKEMTAYSDFPPPSHFPNYMHNTVFLKYLEMYSEHFHLQKYIHFYHEVLQVKKTEDFDKTGRWIVEVMDKEGHTVEEVFAGVMVCTGHHVQPHIPNFPGLSDFRGQIIHARDYKTDKGFEDKRILVIGIGNSGGDISVELSRTAKQVYLSTRRGVWVLNRVGEGGWPLDIAFKTRFLNFLIENIQWNVINYIAEAKANFRFNHRLYCLKPEHRFFSQHPMVNDDLPNRILTGTVMVKGDIVTFTEHGVIFKREERLVYDIDVVILATGYNIQFPFVQDGIIEGEGNRLSLYKYVIPPKLSHPTLAVIGLVQALGSLPPIAEMQSRWVAQLFKKSISVPSQAAMLKDIEVKRMEISRRYVDTQRHTIEVDFITYLDEIASFIGAKPCLWRLFFADLPLFVQCVFGPCVAYQYRLNGPNKWSEARDIILNTKQRVIAPLQTRHVFKPLPTNLDLFTPPPLLTVFGALLLTIIIVLILF